MFPNILKQKKNDTVIFTAITWDKDTLIEPRVEIPGVDFKCFTTRDDLQSDTYEIIKIPSYYGNERKDAKVVKLMPHFFIPEYKYSLWIDGRIVLKIKDMRDFIISNLQESNWAMYKHPERDNVFDEADICIEWKKDSPEKINQQMDTYKKDGYANQYPLYAGTVIARKHMEKDAIDAGESWWEENRNHTLRDQLSFPYVAWKQNLKVKTIDGELRKNKFFQVLTYKAREQLLKGEISLDEK